MKIFGWVFILVAFAGFFCSIWAAEMGNDWDCIVEASLSAFPLSIGMNWIGVGRCESVK